MVEATPEVLEVIYREIMGAVPLKKHTTCPALLYLQEAMAVIKDQAHEGILVELGLPSGKTIKGNCDGCEKTV